MLKDCKTHKHITTWPRLRGHPSSLAPLTTRPAGVLRVRRHRLPRSHPLLLPAALLPHVAAALLVGDWRPKDPSSYATFCNAPACHVPAGNNYFLISLVLCVFLFLPRYVKRTTTVHWNLLGIRWARQECSLFGAEANRQTSWHWQLFCHSSGCSIANPHIYMCLTVFGVAPSLIPPSKLV